MHYDALKDKEAVKYVSGVRVQMDRLIQTVSILNGPGVSVKSEIVMKLTDSRLWLGEMLKGMGVEKEVDKWKNGIPTFSSVKDGLESIHSEVVAAYQEFQGKLFHLNLKEHEQKIFHAGYMRGIFYMIEAALWIENRLNELKSEVVN